MCNGFQRRDLPMGMTLLDASGVPMVMTGSSSPSSEIGSTRYIIKPLKSCLRRGSSTVSSASAQSEPNTIDALDRRANTKRRNVSFSCDMFNRWKDEKSVQCDSPPIMMKRRQKGPAAQRAITTETATTCTMGDTLLNMLVDKEPQKLVKHAPTAQLFAAAAPRKPIRRPSSDSIKALAQLRLSHGGRRRQSSAEKACETKANWTATSCSA